MCDYQNTNFCSNKIYIKKTKAQNTENESD